MNFEKIDCCYQDIVDEIDDIIPEDWDKVLLYANIGDDMSSFFFYYYPHNSSNPVFSEDIVAKSAVNRMTYNLKHYRLLKILEALRQAFMDYGQKLWTNLTLVIDHTGKFNVDYNYDDVSEMNPNEQFERWKSKYLETAE